MACRCFAGLVRGGAGTFSWSHLLPLLHPHGQVEMRQVESSCHSPYHALRDDVASNPFVTTECVTDLEQLKDGEGSRGIVPP